MNIYDQGGPAFPDQGQRINPDGRWAQDYSPGMSLRDYFAGQALAGILGNGFARAQFARVGMDSPAGVAAACYAFADAMLAHRAEGNEPAMKRQLREHIATLTITSGNIGGIRAGLLMPFECEWNGWVRDLTAERENAKLSDCD